MGLPFREIVTAQEIPWDRLSGRTLAVDGYNALYQFLATIRQADGRPLSDSGGRPTSHLVGSFYRTTSLLGQGVLPVWVFDGKPPGLKALTLRARFEVKERAEAAYQEALAVGDLEKARRKAAQTSHLTRAMVEETKELLTALGVPSVQAPSEGEAQAAAMAAKGQVWAAASEDYDSLLFGAPHLVRGLAARSRRGLGGGAQVVHRDELLADLGIDSDELILLGIIVGTDFNEGARGYGPKRALKLVREHLGWDATIARAGLDPKEAQSAAEIFRSPEVVDAPAPRFGPVNEAEVMRVLVEGHGFSEERVHGAVGRARSRPEPHGTPSESRGRQTLLETFGGSSS